MEKDVTPYLNPYSWYATLQSLLRTQQLIGCMWRIVRFYVTYNQSAVGSEEDIDVLHIMNSLCVSALFPFYKRFETFLDLKRRKDRWNLNTASWDTWLFIIIFHILTKSDLVSGNKHYITNLTSDWLQVTYWLNLRHLQPISCLVDCMM